MKKGKIAFIMLLCFTLMQPALCFGATQNEWRWAYATGPLSLENEPRYIGLTGCSLGIGATNNGIVVDYSTGFTKIADELGIKNLQLQVKTSSGWSSIYTIKQKNVKGESSFGGGFTKLIERTGQEYRVTVTHYAIYGGKTYTVTGTTDPLTF